MVLPPSEVGLLLVTTLVGVVVVALATPAMPKLNPDAMRTLSARFRMRARRMPMRECFVPVMMMLLEIWGDLTGTGWICYDLRTDRSTKEGSNTTLSSDRH